MESELDLGRLKELAEKATPGPWCWESVAEKSNEFVVGLASNAKGEHLTGCINGMDYDEELDAWIEDAVIRGKEIGSNESGSANFADAEFIAAARTAVPALVEEVERQKLDNLKLKLSTCSTIWWDEDVGFDSPENFAEENGLKIGDEFELQGARYRDEKFRVTKVADESSDDFECEDISTVPDEFEPYFSILKRAEAAESALSESQAEITRLRARKDYHDEYTEAVERVAELERQIAYCEAHHMEAGGLARTGETK